MAQILSKISRRRWDESVISRSRGSLKVKEDCLQLRRETLPGISLEPNLVSQLLQGCITNQSLKPAQQLHAVIITTGAASDRFTSNHLLNMYAKLRQLPTASALFKTMAHKNIMSSNILLGGFIQNEDLEAARQLFDEMPDRNVATWNAMVTGMAQYGFNTEGLEYFARMTRQGFRPDEFGLASALRSCAGLRDIASGQQVHACAVVCGYETDPCVGSSLAHMYMKCGRLEEGEGVFKAMPMLNAVSCNTIITGRAQNGDAEGAVDYFSCMRRAGLKPDQVTFVSVISSCSDLGILAQGQQVHAQAIRNGVDAAVPVRSSLISMYSKCGCLVDSARVFRESNDADRLDLVLCSAMVAAYGFHGRGQEAIELFERMVSDGIEPSEVTFLSLLYACCHSGLKDKGMEYLELMCNRYSMKPTLRHYTCVVDLLGRSGCLDKAEALIKSMPVSADAVIWKTLLSACKTHKKVEMAERVAEHVLRLDPQDSASYVLLSNIRATKEKWDDVSDVRRAMRERRVRKEPGISWVELQGGEVHQFATGGRSHPKQREINRFLGELMSKIREFGYVPDRSMVYHDMEDEEKEFSLAQHSEKLAIAFALLIMPPETPIRVMKNLRVCNDCHVAIKFISRITEREIVVRDVSRFHHFRDGECSCGDYW
ncbi:TPR-like protein [Dioscorea alata]|uniref:TPR-like protein n=1 Tax=Dioscorea alata TaxID=55571 RepID=A0ACB7VUH6_DIOAL|nr:TPR-like protein [Dioscorea alata]